MALYVCPNHTDDDIHSDHSYLDTPGIPLNSTLKLIDILIKIKVTISISIVLWGEFWEIIQDLLTMYHVNIQEQNFSTDQLTMESLGPSRRGGPF